MDPGSMRSPASITSMSPFAQSPRGTGMFSTVFRDHFLVARFIKDCGVRLKMKAIPLATAAAIYFRFFRECTPKDYDPYLVAMTALYLASKIEENILKIRDVINVAHKLLHRTRPPLDIDQYWLVRDSMCNCELFVLRVLKFKVSFVHPHKYLLEYLWSMGQWIEPKIWERSPVKEAAWAMLNDMYHDDVVLKYKANHIAVAVLYLVFECYGLEVPYNREAKTPWWSVFCEDLVEEQIVEMTGEMMHVYDKERLLLM